MDAGRKILCGHRLEPLLPIGFGNTVAAHRVVAIVTPNSAPMRRLKEEAKSNCRLVDATCGRKTRAVIIMDSNHVVLSSVHAETISLRYAALMEHMGGDQEDEEMVP